MIVKYSYPPKPLSGTGYLSSIPITTGEQFIVSISTNPAPIAAPIPSRITTPAPSIKATNEALSAPSRLTPQPISQASTPSLQPQSQLSKETGKADSGDSVKLPGDNGFLELRVVPDDNSCLFSAIGVVFLGGIDSAQELRRVVVDAIRKDPDTYSEVMLG